MTANISASEPQIPAELKGKYERNTMEYLWKMGKKIRGETLRKTQWQNNIEGMPRKKKNWSTI